MQFWELLNNFDKELLLLINGRNSVFLDWLMPIITFKWTWLPFYAFFIFLLYHQRQSNKSFYFFIFIIIPLGIFISDQLANLFKNELIKRARPCHDEAIGHLIHTVNNYCGGKYGFYSGHSANSFFIATMLVKQLNYSAIKPCLYGWAFLVAFSRVYLGVHYVGDILFGGLMGWLLGEALSFCYKRIISNMK